MFSDCLLDFGLMSLLMVFAHLLRARIKLLQELLLPTPILAGFLALLGGAQAANILPFHMSEKDPTLEQYPPHLVALLFATLLMGKRAPTSTRQTIERVGDTFFYNFAAEIGQYALSLLFGVLVLTPMFPALHPGFALLLPAGFAGGYGSATVVGGILREHGWDEALTIGYTFATIGLWVGVAGGLLLVNVAARLGWTRLVSAPRGLPPSLKAGFLPEKEQPSLGRETISAMAFDSLAWHLALVLAAYAVASLADRCLQTHVPQLPAIPLFALALLAGSLLQKGLELLRLGRYVDRTTMAHVGSSISDYLIAFGVASIKMSLVWEHAWPLLILSLFGVAYSVGLLWFVGRKIFRTYWFERSIFVYGWCTGVVATGIALLRIVDPHSKSRTLEDYGQAYVAICPFMVVVMIVVPAWVAVGHRLLPALVLLGVFLGCLIWSRCWFGWYKGPADAIRDAEKRDVLAGGPPCR